jgi:hypothetical protein
VTTVADVVTDLMPVARTIAGSDAALGRVVSWVRVLRARVPALDGLERGDLVVVPTGTLEVVAATPDETDQLADALVRGAASGIVLVGAEAPAAARLAARAAEGGLAVVALADGEAALLERSVIELLVNRRAALERRAEELERRLEAVALRTSDLGALVASIGGFLGRAVVLEGRRGDPLAVHAPEQPPAAAAAARSYLADREGVALRVLLPVPPADGDRAHELARTGEPPIRGSLLLLGDAPATEGERLACARVAALLALELGRDVAVQRAREVARRSESLPSDGPPWVVILARQAGREDVEDAEQREALRAELRLLAPNRRLVLRGDSESLEYRLVAIAGREDPLGLVIADRVAAFLRRIVVVSRPFDEPGGRSPAEAEARATLEAAEAYGAPAGVVRADRLPAYRILGDLHNLPDAERLARSLLAPMLDGRPPVVAERLRTLRAVLDSPGPAEAAHALGVHRNTVAYRVRRIEDLGGWDLGDPELRVALSVALRIVHNAQV